MEPCFLISLLAYDLLLRFGQLKKQPLLSVFMDYFCFVLFSGEYFTSQPTLKLGTSLTFSGDMFSEVECVLLIASIIISFLSLFFSQEFVIFFSLWHLFVQLRNFCSSGVMWHSPTFSWVDRTICSLEIYGLEGVLAPGREIPEKETK